MQNAATRVARDIHPQRRRRQRIGPHRQQRTAEPAAHAAIQRRQHQHQQPGDQVIRTHLSIEREPADGE